MISFLKQVWRVLLKIGLILLFGFWFLAKFFPTAPIAAANALFLPLAALYVFVRWKFGYWMWPFGPLFRGGNSGAHGNVMRGSQIVGAADLKKIIDREKNPADLEIGGVPIPRNIETRGFLFAGAPGTGKSISITRMLDVLDARGDRAFVADRLGIYTARYYDPDRGDVILNPADARATAWSPLAELRNEHDAEAVARSLVPQQGSGSDGAEWSGYASTFVAGLLWYCLREGLNNGEFLRLVQAAEPAELRQALRGHAAQGLLTEGAERMLGSVRGIASTACAPLARLDPDGGPGSLSIRRWVAEGTPGRLFFPYSADQLRALRGLIAAQADVFAQAVLSLPPSFDRRIWLVLDEFASLGRVSEMENFLTNSRKNGGCAILGMQAVAQVRDQYGRDAAQAMLSSISTSLFLRQPDPETADWASRAIGERQVLRTLRAGGSSESTQGEASSENWSQQVAQERAVLPAELQRLPDAVGYLVIAGGYPIAHLGLSLPEQRADRAQALVAAPPRPMRIEAEASPRRSAPPAPPAFEL